MDCKICPFEDQFWKKPAFSHEDKMLLVKQYYGHSLDLSCFGRSLKLCGISSLEAARIVVGILKQVSCHDILDVIKKDFKPYTIKVTDIPQFSSLDDCFRGVTEAIVTSGLKDITFEKMGYLLRTDPRNTIADKKYGENHSKTAEILGLTSISVVIGKKAVNITPLGEVFYALTQAEQKDLQPKLILYAKMMQNFFAIDENEDILSEMMSELSESTRKRRHTNVMAFINTVKHRLDEEVYGTLF